MINLVKNELIKIFSKKGLYIYGIIIIFIMAFNLVVEKTRVFDNSFTYYNTSEERLSKYDLNNSEELEWYVDEKSDLEKFKLLEDYDSKSPEYYYIEKEVFATIKKMNIYKYIEKNDELFNEAQEEYNNQIKLLEDYDWRLKLEEDKKSLEDELGELKTQGNAESSDDRIYQIECELEGIRYRLKNNVAPSYTHSSSIVDDYIIYSEMYRAMNKDESAYKSNSELIEKRNTEKRYYLAKYNIENDIVMSNDISFRDDFVGDVTGAVMLYIIAMVIIAGGIFAEEFNKGTIKQLLIKPYSRTKIYVSKILAIFIALLAFILFYNTIAFVFYWILDGNISTIFDPIIDYSFRKNAIVEYNTFGYIFIRYLSSLPQFIILILLCVFIGVITTNTVSSVISVFCLDFINALISEFLSEKIIALIPMNCWNFDTYLEFGISAYNYSSLGKSLFICSLTIIILFILGLIIFKRKDIKNQ